LSICSESQTYSGIVLEAKEKAKDYEVVEAIHDMTMPSATAVD